MNSGNFPLVSVIIPVYNNADFLADTISSALDQSWPSREIIIVDDGSADDSLRIAESFNRHAELQIHTQKNAGACAARNKGFALSKGKFIQYLDGDDMLDKEKIAVQMNTLKDYSSDTMASGPWARFSNKTQEAKFQTQKVWDNYKPVGWLVDAWNGGGMMQTACWLTPRHLIEKAGPWNEQLKKNPNDDGEFFCRVLLQAEEIVFCQEAKVYYREHAGSRVSTTSNRDAVESLLGTCMSYEENIFRKENSNRTRQAAAMNYASFIYRFYDEYPDFVRKAEDKLLELDPEKKIVVGGKSFNRLSSLFGFKNTLKFRSAARRLISKK